LGVRETEKAGDVLEDFGKKAKRGKKKGEKGGKTGLPTADLDSKG